MTRTEKKESPYIETSCYNDQKLKKSLHLELSRDNDQKEAYKSNSFWVLNLSLSIIVKNYSLPPAASVLPLSAMAQNTFAFLHKLICTNFVDFRKSEDKFGRFSLSKKDSNYLNLNQHQVLKRDRNRDFRRVPNLTMGEEDLKRFMRLTNELVFEAENFGRREKLSPVLIPTVPEDTDEQRKLAHEVIDVVDQANRKVCVTVLRYNVENLESSCAQVRLLAKRKEKETFQTIVQGIKELEYFVFFLLDEMDSVYDKVITKKPICDVLKKEIATNYSISILFAFESG